MAKIRIIMGTVTGTAQGVAEYCQKKLAAQHRISINQALTGADLTRTPKSNTGRQTFLTMCRP